MCKYANIAEPKTSHTHTQERETAVTTTDIAGTRRGVCSPKEQKNVAWRTNKPVNTGAGKVGALRIRVPGEIESPVDSGASCRATAILTTAVALHINNNKHKRSFFDVDFLVFPQAKKTFQNRNNIFTNTQRLYTYKQGHYCAVVVQIPNVLENTYTCVLPWYVYHRMGRTGRLEYCYCCCMLNINACKRKQCLSCVSPVICARRKAPA